MDKQFAQLEQSHMPYMAPAADGVTGFFFCVKNHLGVWKLRRFWENSLLEVATGLPEDWNECCPVADFDDGLFSLSFVAGPTREAGRNGLYQFKGLPNDDTVKRLCDADVGFARQNWLAHGSRRGPLIINRGGRERELHIEGLDFLYRVCPDAFAPSRLLITATVAGVDRSIIYDVHSGACKIVTFQDSCMYKFAAHPAGGFVYALRGVGDNEDRRVVQSGSVVRVATPGLIQLKEPVKTDSMDCVACFRKHIAAALSFAKEIMAGHGAGDDLDHRPDLAGEIASAEQHAKEMTVAGYAKALRELRHRLDAQGWETTPDDLSLLRRLWKSSMGVDCGCRKHRGEGKK